MTPKDREALMSLSTRLSFVSVSELKSPEPSKAISSIIILVSCGRAVPLSHANLRNATAVLNVHAEDSRTCFEEH